MGTLKCCEEPGIIGLGGVVYIRSLRLISVMIVRILHIEKNVGI